MKLVMGFFLIKVRNRLEGGVVLRGGFFGSLVDRIRVWFFIISEDIMGKNLVNSDDF